MPYQANGELAKVHGELVGSYLIDNNFTSPAFFHARPFNESASGVDPDINLTNAYDQVPRISNWTRIPSSNIMGIINSHVQGTFWIFGSPYVDVLQLNIILINTYPQVYQGYPKS
jgi:K+-transporting ATPase ATPase C chain